MSEDRKRLIISIGAAVLLHLLILVLTGINRPDYETAEEFGPITVEISLDKPQVRPPEPEPEQIRDLNTEEAPPAVVEKTEPSPSAQPEPEAVTIPVPEAAAVTPAVVPRSYAPVVSDDSFIETLKQRSSTGGIDARSVFGDDPVPSTTDMLDLPAAAGANEGSEVLLTDSQPVAERNDKPQPDEPSEMSVIEAGDLSSLDRLLSTGIASDDEQEQASSETPASEVKVSSAEVSGQSRSLKFDNPAQSRELITFPPPGLPADIQTAGIAKYTVVIEFDIDSDGITSGFLIRRPSTDPRIDAAVQKALRGWIFKESTSSENKKVRAILTYVIEIK